MAPALGSTGSSAGRPAPFVGFSATMAECDFSCPFITGYGSSAFPTRSGGANAPGWARESPGFRSEELAHMPGSATSRDRRCARIDAHPHVAFRRDKSVGVPIDNFAAQWLAYAFPCRRLRLRPRDRKRTARGRWFATPSPQWTCTTYSPAGLPAHRHRNTMKSADERSVPLIVSALMKRGELPVPSATTMLVRALDHAHPRVRQCAAVALTRRRSRAALPNLIKHYAKEGKVMRRWP